MLVSVVYEIVLFFAFLVVSPKAIYDCLRYKKHRSNFLKRLGVGFPRIARKGKGPIIWVHAVSVGECHAAQALIKRLQSEIQEVTIVVSSVSETGHFEAKKTLASADYHVYLPFDFYLCVRCVLKRVMPNLVILVEGDFWYRFLKETKKQGAVALVVNGKVSETSARRFCRLSFFTKPLFTLLDFICVQSELYRERFLRMGVAASKVLVTGNLKCDSLPVAISDAELDELREKLHLKASDKVVVVGSTHEPEEEIILNQLHSLLKKYPQLKVLIAPRHPERFSAVAALMQKQGLGFASWTKGSDSNNPQHILIDAMGILRKCYQLADVAIVAGSFTNKVGGHNIMEAQVFGKPVICGPYMHSQPQLVECAKYYDAILQVQPHNIGSSVEQIMSDEVMGQKLGKNALTMVTAMRGATDRTFGALYNLTPQFFACNKAG